MQADRSGTPVSHRLRLKDGQAVAFAAPEHLQRLPFAAVLADTLQDLKVCAIDPIWSGLNQRTRKVHCTAQLPKGTGT
jgi:hypothetical protein